MYTIFKIIIITITLVLVNFKKIKHLASFLILTEVMWVLLFTCCSLSSLYVDDVLLSIIPLLILVLAAIEVVMFSLIYVIFKK